MTTTQKIFECQIWHLLSLMVLVISVYTFVTSSPDKLEGFFWGLSTISWFWIAIVSPILHQIYVWFVWRLELYLRFFSKQLGIKKAFKIYAAGFSILFFSRLITIIFLAISSKNTLQLSPIYVYVLAVLIVPFVIFLFYSVKKYFTIARAYGIDHFDTNYNEPYVRKGIFKYTDNGMYAFGLMILYLPGLLFLSEAALLVALFNHVYIWVHYYFTERPDMLKIYGHTP